MEMTTEELSTYRQTTLPKAIDRLFLRMASLYGKHWIDMWADIPMDAVKEEWQGGLYGFSLLEIGDAINHCAENNKFPPTLPEFRDLCRDMKRKHQPTHKALPRHYTKEEREANHQRLQQAFKVVRKHGGNRDWAIKILEQHEQDPRSVQDIALRFAHEAVAAA
jgi:hypothetical protein